MFGKPARILALFIVSLLAGYAVAAVTSVNKNFESPILSSNKLKVGNLSREYYVHKPKDLPRESPVVFVLHGGGGPLGSAELMMKKSGWSEKAEKEKFLVVFPQGLIEDENRPLNLETKDHKRNFRTWSDGSGVTNASLRGIDDVSFISKLIDEIDSKYNSDKRKIFVTGFSNGATMSYALGAKLSNKIAAIAPIAGLLYVRTPPANPVSLISIVGAEDKPPPLKHSGFLKQVYAANLYVLNPVPTWKRYLLCNSKTDQIVNNPDYIKIDSGLCENGSSVVSYIMKGMGHVFPGRANLFDAGKGLPDNYSAVDMVWNFFSKHFKKDL